MGPVSHTPTDATRPVTLRLQSPSRMVAPMSAELIGILAVGVALCGVIVAGQRRLEGRYERGMAALESRYESGMAALESRYESGMAALESRLESRMSALESHLEKRISALESHLEKRISALESRLESRMSALESRLDAVEHGLADLRERMARLEGLLDGLREAIVPDGPGVTRRNRAKRPLRLFSRSARGAATRPPRRGLRPGSRARHSI